MKNLVALVTLIFVATALFAQKDMPAGINDVFNQNNPDPQKEFLNKHNKIPGQTDKEFLFVRNINGTIWVKDSTLYYNGNGTEWDLIWREKTLTRDDFGNMTTAISQAWDNTNGSWGQYLNTFWATYYNTDFTNEYLEKKWNSQTNEWSDTSFYEKYNEDGNNIKYIYRSWNNDSNSFPGYGYKYLKTYDDKGNLTRKLRYDWDGDTQEWVDPWLSDSYIYDEIWENLLQCVEYTWDSQTEEWINSYLYIYSYDATGNNTKYRRQEWNSETEKWINTNQSLYAYDDNGNITQRVTQIWDAGTGEWINNRAYLYTYDDNENRTVYLWLKWNNEIEDWIYSYVILTIYDDNKNPTQEVWQIWNSDIEDWVNMWADLYTYDDNGNLTVFLWLEWNNEIEDWIYYYCDLYTYDGNGNLIQAVWLYWNSDIEDWVNTGRYDYYWSEFETSGINDVSNHTIAVYPNPSRGLVTIVSDFKLTGKIEILNVSGKIVHSVHITSESQQINLRNLSKGIYFIKVTSDNYHKTEKLILE